MKKIILLILSVILLSSFVFAIDTTIYSINPNDYYKSDFSNPTLNGSNVTDGTLIIHGNWTATSSYYSDNHSNTSTLSIKLILDDFAKYQLGGFPTNATCFDFMIPTGNITGDKFFSVLYHKGSGVYPHFAIKSSPELKYYSGSAYITTGMWFENLRWYTICMYWNGSKKLLTMSNSSDCLVINPISTGGAWEENPFLPANNVYFGMSISDGSPTIYIDNVLFFNGGWGSCDKGVYKEEIVTEVIIHSPEDNSTTRNESYNVTFSFSGFNATSCNLYDNLTGDFQICNSINCSVYNITTNKTEESLEFILNETVLFLRFEDNNTPAIAIDSSDYGNNGTIFEAVYSDSKGSNETGNFSLLFDGTNDFVNVSHSDSLDIRGKVTISAWVYPTVNSNADIVIKYYLTPTPEYWTLKLDKAGVVLRATGSIWVNDTEYEATGTTSLTLNEWNHIAMTYNNSHVSVYKNGVREAVSPECLFCIIDNNTEILRIGGSDYFTGKIDEVAIFNNSADDSLIQYIYNSGIQRLINITVFNMTFIDIPLSPSTNYSLECSLPSDSLGYINFFVNCFNGENINSSILSLNYDTDFSPPNITILFPTINNDTFNFNMWINFTTNEIADCELNIPEFETFIDNGTYFSFNETNLNNSFHELTINCSDTRHTFAPVNYNTFIVNFTKDILYPLINILSPLNNSEWIIGEDNLQIKYVVTDNRDLFSINYNITESFTGNIVFQKNLTVSGLTYSENFLIDIANYTPDSYFFSIKACDSHTDKKIKEAKSIIKTNNTLKYQFGNTNINIKSLSGKEKKADTKKLEDRYTFEFEYSSYVSIKKYELISNQEIVYRPNSEYKGHFIIGGKYWIDFEQEGNLIVSKDDDSGNWIIEIDNPDNKISFNSLGELSCTNSQTYFNVLIEEEPIGINLTAFDLSNLNNVVILFFIGFLWVAVMILAFSFKNFGFASFGFFLGLILGFMLSGVHIFLTLLFWLLNITIFTKYAIAFK